MIIIRDFFKKRLLFVGNKGGNSVMMLYRDHSGRRLSGMDGSTKRQRLTDDDVHFLFPARKRKSSCYQNNDNTGLLILNAMQVQVGVFNRL